MYELRWRMRYLAHGVKTVEGINVMQPRKNYSLRKELNSVAEQINKMKAKRKGAKWYVVVTNHPKES